MIALRKREVSRYFPFLIIISLKISHKLQPLKENKFQITKSRYDSVDSYISQTWRNRPEYNDNPFAYDEPIYERLRNHGKINLYQCDFYFYLTFSLLVKVSTTCSQNILHIYLFATPLSFSVKWLTRMTPSAQITLRFVIPF